MGFNSGFKGLILSVHQEMCDYNTDPYIFAHTFTCLWEQRQ